VSELGPFLTRVLQRIPAGAAGITDWVFKSWTAPGKITDEAVGLLPVPGVDRERFLGRVMNLDAYVGPIPHVIASRTIADPAWPPPAKARFYQRVRIPLLGDVHQEIGIARAGEHAGYEIAEWRMLDRETAALSGKEAIRGQYNEGAWLVAPGVVGYALSSAPRREDVGFLKWKALTTGADVAAAKVIRDNIAAMARWATRD
jgi:hypothetical protein